MKQALYNNPKRAHLPWADRVPIQMLRFPASEPELTFTPSLGSTPAGLVPPRFKQEVLTGTPGAIWSFVWYSSASSVLLYRQRQRHPDSAKNLGNK